MPSTTHKRLIKFKGLPESFAAIFGGTYSSYPSYLVDSTKQTLQAKLRDTDQRSIKDIDTRRSHLKAHIVFPVEKGFILLFYFLSHPLPICHQSSGFRRSMHTPNRCHRQTHYHRFVRHLYHNSNLHASIFRRSPVDGSSSYIFHHHHDSHNMLLNKTQT